MSVIKVNLDELQVTQKHIQQSLKECNQQIKEMNQMSLDISVNWKGKDYDAFLTIIRKNIKETHSMYEQLSHLASYLSYSYSQYDNLKSRLCNRAKLLPK